MAFDFLFKERWRRHKDLSSKCHLHCRKVSKLIPGSVPHRNQTVRCVNLCAYRVTSWSFIHGTGPRVLILCAECRDKCPASWWPQSITHNRIRTPHTNAINSLSETMRNNFRTPLFTNNKFWPNMFFSRFVLFCLM